MPAISISISAFRHIRRTLVPSQSLQFCLSWKFPFKYSIRQIYMENHHTNDSRGALIVLEGLDRCGKTSQSKRLLYYLQGLGHSVESGRFPDRTTSVGLMISSYLSNESQLDDHTIHLLFSANRWEKRSLMEAKLRSGTTLIVDRYSYSGVAFTSAKGFDIEWCKAPEIGLLAPDLVVYLDITPEKAAERGGYGTERYEKVEFQKKVAQSYHILRDASWKIVDATLPIEEIEKQIREVALDCVMTCKKEVVRAEGKRCVLNRSLSWSSSQSSNYDNSGPGNYQSGDDREKEYIMLGLQIVGGLSLEFSNVKKAASIDYDAIDRTSKALTAQIAEVRKLVLECETGEGGFSKQMKIFLGAAEKEMKILREEQSRVMDLVKRTQIIIKQELQMI